MTDYHTPLYNFCFLYTRGLVLAIWIMACLCYAFLNAFKDLYYYWPVILITVVLIACLGMVLTHTTLMIRTKITNYIYLPLVYIRRPLFVFLVQLTIFGICFLPLGYVLLGHLLSGSIQNHLMHSKGVCLIWFFTSHQQSFS